MPKLTQEHFAQNVKAVAEGRGKVKNVRVGDFSVVADIVSRSGKSAYQWTFMFDEVTGKYQYSGAFANANEPCSLVMRFAKQSRGLPAPERRRMYKSVSDAPALTVLGYHRAPPRAVGTPSAFSLSHETCKVPRCATRTATGAGRGKSTRQQSGATT